MRVAGIIVGIIGAGLFTWHSIKVVMGTDISNNYLNHQILSLVGGVLVIIGIGLYIQGRRSTPPES